ncbi:hypothetical protein BCF74_10114 [Knoellia remsis]|uniref:DUF11 domain-containing protein n=1 Tax=Knoellia remsis TaxID=407159 RepID=A0A2T0V0D4_9MICO|nr:hypothetical protein [Knoellia remsis]PRY63616.1 hypothetical protein BCF74_10114 [Knoellia remsis]
MTEVRSALPSRRTIAMGAAWSVPVMAVAAAAPALAASAPGPTAVLGEACKSPGGSCKVFVKGYIFEITIVNNTPETVWLYDDIVITDDSPSIDLAFAQAIDPATGETVDFPVRLDPGDSVTFILNASSSDSANQQGVTVTASIPWGHSSVEGGDPDNHAPIMAVKTYPATPPTCGIKLPPGC